MDNAKKLKNKKTVLIVDDTELNRVMLSEILAPDYEVMEASTGLEAEASRPGTGWRSP